MAPDHNHHNGVGFVGFTNLGIFFAALWFLLTGLIQVFGLDFANQGIILGIIALIAGICLMIRR